MDDYKYCDYKYRKLFNDLIIGYNFILKTEFDNNIVKKNKPVIFYGNHINNFDQFIITSSTNIMIHWVTNLEILNGIFGNAYRLMKCIPDDENVNETVINYLNVGSSIGIFPEIITNVPSCKKIQELYSELRSGLTYYGYEKIIREENVKLSQINLLQRLFYGNKISDADYQKGLLSTEIVLFECTEKGIITKEEFDDALLLPFKDTSINKYKETGAVILPFAITEKGYNTKDMVINFGDLIEMDDLNEDELRGKVLNLVKKGERRS